jgi:hypothetical protein
VEYKFENEQYSRALQPTRIDHGSTQSAYRVTVARQERHH